MGKSLKVISSSFNGCVLHTCLREPRQCHLHNVVSGNFFSPREKEWRRVELVVVVVVVLVMRISSGGEETLETDRGWLEPGSQLKVSNRS